MPPGIREIWALSQENLSLGFATSWDTNRPAQLQRLARVLILEMSAIASRGIILSKQRTIQVLIRLLGCAGWSAPLLFANGKSRFFHDMAHIKKHTGTQDWSIISTRVHSRVQYMVFCRGWDNRIISLSETDHEKTCLCQMRPTKTLISLCIRTIWSAPLLFAS